LTTWESHHLHITDQRRRGVHDLWCHLGRQRAAGDAGADPVEQQVTSVTLALAPAFEAPERDVMWRPPRFPGVPILSRFVILRILFGTTAMGPGL